MRIGILGTNFGKVHAEFYNKFQDVEIDGIVGRDKPKTLAVAESLGIDPIKVQILVFVIAGILAGFASCLVAPISTLSPYMGIMYTLKGIVITILGGLGKVGGAIIASFILGLSESLVIGYINPDLQYALPFLFLVIILLLKPQGLFGGKGEEI